MVQEEEANRAADCGTCSTQTGIQRESPKGQWTSRSTSFNARYDGAKGTDYAWRGMGSCIRIAGLLQRSACR
jgi:hypothetical protein